MEFIFILAMWMAYLLVVLLRLILCFVLTVGKSLLSMWTSRLNAMHSEKRNEFAGRLESAGNTAELYIHLKDDG